MKKLLIVFCVAVFTSLISCKKETGDFVCVCLVRGIDGMQNHHISDSSVDDAKKECQYIADEYKATFEEYSDCTLGVQ